MLAVAGQGGAMKLGVVGCAGRMGAMLVRAITANDDCTLAAAIGSPAGAAIGQDAGVVAGLGALGLIVGDDPLPLFAQCDGVIDFTVPEATVRFAALAAQSKSVHVIGTTGLSPADRGEVEKAARHTAIVMAPNMSVGINLLMALTRQVAQVLDQDYDIEIVEMHHRRKVDAPSGTAIGLGHAAAAGRQIDLDAQSTRVRDGHIGPRPAGQIGFASLRGGDVVGDHMVIFAGPGERIELGHRAGSREIYANGAIRAALWAQGRPSGLYTMSDVLGL